MADIKTILRELSVVVGYLVAIKKFNEEDVYVVDKFVTALKSFVTNLDDCEFEIEKIANIVKFNLEQKSIILNGTMLGKHIFKKLKPKGEIKWLGFENKNENPSDISIGTTKISLKEDSDILKNPAFAKYLNAIAEGATIFKNVHIFRDFAKDEFENWFKYTFTKLREIATTTKVEDVIYSCEKHSVLYYIKRGENSLIFGADDDYRKFEDNELITEFEFDKRMNKKTIEYTLSKWINENLEKNEEYLKLKKKCSLSAGENLKTFIEKNNNVNKYKILALLQIYADNYFYGKCISRKPQLFKVPNIKECIVEITNIEYSVPKSQLNLIVTFDVRIHDEQNEIVMRVECRYSHGQFKGIPEAKLYCKDDLKKLYTLL